jgi:hypothetical protein
MLPCFLSASIASESMQFVFFMMIARCSFSSAFEYCSIFSLHAGSFKSTCVMVKNALVTSKHGARLSIGVC